MKNELVKGEDCNKRTSSTVVNNGAVRELEDREIVPYDVQRESYIQESIKLLREIESLWLLDLILQCIKNVTK